VGPGGPRPFVGECPPMEAFDLEAQ